MKRILRVGLILWLGSVAWLALPIRLPTNPESIEYDGSRILVTLQETTGPMYRVVGGSDGLRSATIGHECLTGPSPVLEKLNTTEIELLGQDPANIVSYWCLSAHDWVLTGHVVGLSAQWLRAFSGVVPLFWADGFRPTRYIPNFLNRRGVISIAIHVFAVVCAPLMFVGILLVRIVRRVLGTRA